MESGEYRNIWGANRKKWISKAHETLNMDYFYDLASSPVCSKLQANRPWVRWRHRRQQKPTARQPQPSHLTAGIISLPSPPTERRFLQRIPGLWWLRNRRRRKNGGRVCCHLRLALASCAVGETESTIPSKSSNAVRCTLVGPTIMSTMSITPSVCSLYVQLNLALIMVFLYFYFSNWAWNWLRVVVIDCLWFIMIVLYLIRVLLGIRFSFRVMSCYALFILE